MVIGSDRREKTFLVHNIYINLGGNLHGDYLGMGISSDTPGGMDYINSGERSDKGGEVDRLP